MITVFVDLPNTKIELIAPLGEHSPIAAFLERNPAGGIHHLCYEVADVAAASRTLAATGARVLGAGRRPARMASRSSSFIPRISSAR